MGYFLTAFRPHDINLNNNSVDDDSFNANKLLEEIRFKPFIIAISFAFVTSFALVLWKLYHNKYKFEHFFVLGFAMTLIFIGSILLVALPRDSKFYYLNIISRNFDF